ncbi:MAG: AAA family ATPase [Bacteroidia bacterium]|nr:AAA family ATPase [Bacteroidia bacterium]
MEYIQRSTFISYTETFNILKKFSDLVEYPQIDRMPNYLLVSETNNGKSALLREFESRYQVKNSPETGPQLTVLYFQAPAKADESRLYSTILEHLNHPHNDSDIASNKLKQVKRLINSLGIRILIIDELHNIAPSTATKQREFLTILKYLSNELKISMICAGTPAVYDVITYDPQVANRFEPINLISWNKKPEDFIAFLKRYEQRLPLKNASNLAQRELASKIFKMGEGLLGEYVTILKKAGVLAIESKDEKITLDILSKISFIPPSERSRHS